MCSEVWTPPARVRAARPPAAFNPGEAPGIPAIRRVLGCRAAAAAASRSTSSTAVGTSVIVRGSWPGSPPSAL